MKALRELVITSIRENKTPIQPGAVNHSNPNNVRESLLTGLNDKIHDEETLMLNDIVKYFKSSKVKVVPSFIKEFFSDPSIYMDEFQNCVGDAAGADRAAKWLVEFEEKYLHASERFNICIFSSREDPGTYEPIKDLPKTLINKVMASSKLKTICGKYPGLVNNYEKYIKNTSKFIITDEQNEEPYIIFFVPKDINGEDEKVWMALIKNMIKNIK